METEVRADSRELQESLKVAKQLSRIDVKVFKVVEAFHQLKPGRSLLIKAWDGLSSAQVYRKLYFVRTKIAPKVVESELLEGEVYLQEIMQSFLEWRQNEYEGYIVLHKALAELSDAGDVVGDEDSEEVEVIRKLHKTLKQQVKRIERDREVEERSSLLISIQEEMETPEEESIDKGLPPSAGKTERSEDDDWLASILGK